MSLLKRFLGIDLEGDSNEGDSPTIERIATVLEDMPKERAHYIAAFAYILARAANADLRIEGSEIDAMIRATSALGDLTEEEARLAVDIALTQTRAEGGTSNYLVTRKFRDMSSREQRFGLVECLYAITAADGSISTIESAEILKISEELGLARQETNALKSGWKEHLAEFQGLAKNR